MRHRMNRRCLVATTRSVGVRGMHGGAAAVRMSVAIDGDGKSRADLPHPLSTEPAKALHEHRDGNALDGIEIHGRTQRNGIIFRFEHHFAGQPADCRGTRRHQRTAQPRYCDISREHHHRAPTESGKLAPPDLAPSRQ